MQKITAMKGKTKDLKSSLYNPGDHEREIPVAKIDGDESYRSTWRRDTARLLHSPSFRRLQGKTQVFPDKQSDFFRNRLTHSLEVAQIAKSISIKVNAEEGVFKGKKFQIDPDLVEFAALAHDLGHPPFGHNGEAALDEVMIDSGGFEGNAQTLHVVARVEKKERQYDCDAPSDKLIYNGTDLRGGLNLSYRTLASILKYDNKIPQSSRQRIDGEEIKGYYHDYEDLVKRIKIATVGDENVQNFKTIECSIMDVADDIAYSTYDLEDCFKSGHLNPLKLTTLPDEVYEAACKTINKRIKKYYPDKPYNQYAVKSEEFSRSIVNIFSEIFEEIEGEKDIVESQYIPFLEKKALLSSRVARMSYNAASNGYTRTQITSQLVQRFLDGLELVEHPVYPQLHNVRLDIDTFITVEILKNVVFNYVIMSPELQAFETRGKDIVKTIFWEIQDDKKNRLLPADYRALCTGVDQMQRDRLICDFVAGMTDRYAWEFYGRIKGTNNHSMFIPV